MKDIISPVDTDDGLFHDGDPTTETEGTIVYAKIMNDLQGATIDLQTEMKTILTAAGFKPDPTKENQLLLAIQKIVSGGISNAVKDATTQSKGIVQLSSATDSISETLAATPKAVKAAWDLAKAAMPQRPLQDVLSPVWFKIVTFDGNLAGSPESRLEFELSGASYANAGVKEMSADRVYLSLNDILNTQRITSATVGNVIRQVSSGKKINPSEFLVGVTEEVDANKKTTRYTFWLGKTVYHASTLTLNMLTQQPAYAVVTTDFSASDAQTMTEPTGIVYARREETFTTDNPPTAAQTGTLPKEQAMRQIRLPPGAATHWLKIASMIPANQGEVRLEVELSGMSDYGGDARNMATDRVYMTTRRMPTNQRVTSVTVGTLIQQFALGHSVSTSMHRVGVTEEVSNGNTTRYDFWLQMTNHSGISSTMSLLNNTTNGVTVTDNFSGANTTSTEPAGIVYAVREQFITTANPQTADNIGAVKKAGDTMTGQLIAPSVASTPEAMPHGAGAYVDQLSLQAPFFQPNWQWPVNAGGLFVPIAKGTSTRKGQGYPTAVSFGYLMPANHEHAHPTIHAKGDSNVDAAWDFNPYNGNISSKAGTFATQEWVSTNTYNANNPPPIVTQAVTSIRLSGRTVVPDTGGRINLPAGCVFTGMSGANYDPSIWGAYSVIQVLINGQWATIGSV